MAVLTPNDLEIAFALEELILGGGPFNYPCGCFGRYVEVYEWNANWVRVELLQNNCNNESNHTGPPSTLVNWRTRDGEFITVREWDAHTKLAKYTYGLQAVRSAYGGK